MSAAHTDIYSAYTERIVQVLKQPPDLRSTAVVTLAIAVATWLGVSLISEWLSPLRSYPGPPLASEFVTSCPFLHHVFLTAY
jgi:hypothetical protein